MSQIILKPDAFDLLGLLRAVFHMFTTETEAFQGCGHKFLLGRYQFPLNQCLYIGGIGFYHQAYIIPGYSLRH